VKGLDGRWRVVLDADASAIDWIRILKFKDYSQLADQQALAATHLPPVITENPDDRIIKTPTPTPTPTPTQTPTPAPAPAPKTATPPRPAPAPVVRPPAPSATPPAPVAAPPGGGR
jgi:rod shape-determining protein MreC